MRPQTNLSNTYSEKNPQLIILALIDKNFHHLKTLGSDFVVAFLKHDEWFAQ